MPTHTIKGAHIFSVGTWNKKHFTEQDLDDIAHAFAELRVAGRVPLKFGHNDEQGMTDGQPALGWVSRVWREGTKLLADFVDVPTSVFNAIKSGAYKFVSIELLRDAEWKGNTYAYALDAVALLGADPPAVRDLEDLQKLVASRQVAGEVLAFSMDFTVSMPARDIGRRRREAEQLSELERLRAENAALATRAGLTDAERDTFARATGARIHFTAARERIEQHVREGKLTPAVREALYRGKLKDPDSAATFTVEDEKLLLSASHPVTERMRGRMGGSTAHELNSGARTFGSRGSSPFTEAEPHELIAQRCRELVVAGHAPDTFAALPMVIAQNSQARESMREVISNWRGER